MSYNVNVFALKKKDEASEWFIVPEEVYLIFSHTPKASSFSFLQVNGELCFSLANFHDIFSFFLCSVINAIPIRVIDTQRKT